MGSVGSTAISAPRSGWASILRNRCFCEEQRLRRTRAQADEQPEVSDLALLSIDEVEGGNLSVPAAMDIIDDGYEENPALEGGEPWCTPDYIVHITKICPAGEPVVPSGYPIQPWPPPTSASDENT